MQLCEPMTTARPESVPTWSYEEAFCRHQGLFSAAEQQRLRRCRVAIAGMGGVGGVHLMTLARLGIGAFHIADPDTFELANFNRQYGASLPTLGRNKAEVMAELVRTVNPEAEVRTFTDPLGPDNLDEFLDGADVVVDGIDAFVLDVRRSLFKEARQRGQWVVTSGPIGFTTVWLTFSPTGISFDEYFDLNDSMSWLDQFVAFAVGIAPQALHRLDYSPRLLDVNAKWGPSTGLACHVSSGIVAAEVVKILLQRPVLRPAPWFFQFDPCRQRLACGRLRWGNRGPWQRCKRWWFARQLRRGSLGCTDSSNHDHCVKGLS